MTRSKARSKPPAASAAPPASIEDAGRKAAIFNLAVPAFIAIVTIYLGFTYFSKPAWTFDETYYYPGATTMGRWFEKPVFDEGHNR